MNRNTLTAGNRESTHNLPPSGVGAAPVVSIRNRYRSDSRKAPVLVSDPVIVLEVDDEQPEAAGSDRGKRFVQLKRFRLGSVDPDEANRPAGTGGEQGLCTTMKLAHEVGVGINPRLDKREVVIRLEIVAGVSDDVVHLDDAGYLQSIRIEYTVEPMADKPGDIGDVAGDEPVQRTGDTPQAKPPELIGGLTGGTQAEERLVGACAVVPAHTYPPRRAAGVAASVVSVYRRLGRRDTDNSPFVVEERNGAM